MKYLGLDAGSVSVKIVMMDDSDHVLDSVYERHKGHPLETALRLLEGYADSGYRLTVTGASAKLIAEILNLRHINEIIAQSHSTKLFYPDVRSIIELGGEDSKFILMDERGIKDFAMNSVCAAGTGSFLDQQAERMRLSIEEFSELSLKSKTPPRIAGRCSVFAKSDMIHLQQIATPVEDIVSGLCFAVARNFKGTIVKGRPVAPAISFQGGVALNKGMVRAFREVFEIENLIIPTYTAFMGAIGAVLYCKEIEGFIELTKPVIEILNRQISAHGQSGNGKRTLIVEGDNFARRHLEQPSGVKTTVNDGTVVRGYMGVDIGSISTNLAIIDTEGRLLSKRYIMTASRPIEAVMQGLGEIAEEFSGGLDILGVGTTGSGRYMIADFIGADIVKNEITAQAMAAVHIDRTVDTIFEIGGQDSKYISLQDGVIVDFEMNKACAAGTGSFLEEQADKLNISIKGEFASCAFSSQSPCSLGERCTVFMENSLMANLQRGVANNDLLAGLAYSIVENYINRVVAGRKIGGNIFFQGGTAFNKAVVAAFEKFTGKMITVPPNHDVTGAIGMAIIAKDHMEREGGVSKFKGFDIRNRTYKVTSFECKSCSNLCEINNVKIEGEKKKLYYGGRCEKYDFNKTPNDIPDLFAYRTELLWADYGSKKTGNGIRPKIGIPYIFFFHDFLPFYKTLLDKLGFEVIISPKTNRPVINLGLETVLSETCFPVKVAHGHIKHLIQEGVNEIFIPSFINLNRPDNQIPKGSPCPYTQTIPYLARAAFPGVTPITPVIDFSRSDGFLIDEIKKAFRRYRFTNVAVRAAVRSAKAAMREFNRKKAEKGREILAGIDRNTIVVIGRAYNAFDEGINLQLPQKLAGLNVLAIPMDFLPLNEVIISDDWKDMYWRSGQAILKAARYIKEHDHLYPLYIGNFNCGPDSFILNFFKKELGDKPYLHIEIDEHSADAGAVTRCEAFLDSIANRKPGEKPPAFKHVRPSAISRGKVIYVPRMSDHSYALAAAFRSCGIEAEVLPATDREAIELGRKYVSGKECYPCVVTSGDMLKKVFSEGFDPKRSIFFMPSGTGPCRFGQYNVLQRQLLGKIGFEDVSVFAPVQDTTFYEDLGIVGGDFAMRAWKGIVAIEMLTKCLHETRPMERNSGETDAVYQRFLDMVYKSLCAKADDIEEILKAARTEFEGIERVKGGKPLIGVIGEIFVRSNKFSNEDLVRKIELLGGRVWLAPVEEWIYYVNHFGLKHALLKKDISGMIGVGINRLVQRRIEHKYVRHFKGFLETLTEPSTDELLKKANKYVHESFEGETVLSIGKSIDLIEKGVCGIVNAMPFGCMPGTIVTALMRSVSKDYSVPTISIPYDGTESGGTTLQLEAFMEQASGFCIR